MGLAVEGVLEKSDSKGDSSYSVVKLGKYSQIVIHVSIRRISLHSLVVFDYAEYSYGFLIWNTTKAGLTTRMLGVIAIN